MKFSAEDRSARTELFFNMPPLKEPLDSLYPKKNDMAVIIPVFYLKNFLKRQTPEIEGYLKRAFWLAYELLHFGGLAETNADIYIATHSELYPRLEPYRALCKFPESQIFQVEDIAMFSGYMPNIFFLHELCKATPHTFFVRMDTSRHLNAKYPLLQGIREYWKDSPTDMLFPNALRAENNDNPPSKRIKILNGAIRNKGDVDFDKLYRHLPTYFKCSSYEHFLEYITQYLTIVSIAGIYGVPRVHILSDIWTDFLNYIKATGCVGNEEFFLCLYEYLSKSTYKVIEVMKANRSSASVNLVRNDSVRKLRENFADTWLTDSEGNQT